jgi:N6-adenosine-specific RNA methylase IME4
MMKFNHILADPAWRYNNRLSGKGRTKFGSGASGKYRVETTEAMTKFPVESLVDKEGCQLHLWCTGPFIPDALQLFSAWKARYLTLEFVWVKTVKETPRGDALRQLWAVGMLAFMRSKVRILPGHYTASNAEFVLLGSWGKAMLPEVKLCPQVIVAPPMSHSRKPDNVHEYIEACYPGQRYIELFARRTRENWVTLGDEIDGKDLRESIPQVVGY